MSGLKRAASDAAGSSDSAGGPAAPAGLDWSVGKRPRVEVPEAEAEADTASPTPGSSGVDSSVPFTNVVLGGFSQMNDGKAMLTTRESMSIHSPHSLPQFQRRLASFSLSAWCWCGPLWSPLCSPVACAQHGWWLSGYECLSCEHCESKLEAPTAFSEASLEQWHVQLQTTHKEWCPYRTSRCPENGFTRFDVNTICFDNMKERFTELCEGTAELGEKLVLEKSCEEIVEKRRAQFEGLWKQFGGEGDFSMETRGGACLVLAVCGWVMSSYKKLGPILYRTAPDVVYSDSILYCPMCMETVSSSILQFEGSAEVAEKYRLFHPTTTHLLYCPFSRTQSYRGKLHTIFAKEDTEKRVELTAPLAECGLLGKRKHDEVSASEAADDAAGSPEQKAACAQRDLQGYEWVLEVLQKQGGPTAQQCTTSLSAMQTFLTDMARPHMEKKRKRTLLAVLTAVSAALIAAAVATPPPPPPPKPVAAPKKPAAKPAHPAGVKTATTKPAAKPAGRGIAPKQAPAKKLVVVGGSTSITTSKTSPAPQAGSATPPKVVNLARQSSWGPPTTPTTPAAATPGKTVNLGGRPAAAGGKTISLTPGGATPPGGKVVSLTGKSPAPAAGKSIGGKSISLTGKGPAAAPPGKSISLTGKASAPAASPGAGVAAASKAPAAAGGGGGPKMVSLAPKPAAKTVSLTGRPLGTSSPTAGTPKTVSLTGGSPAPKTQPAAGKTVSLTGRTLPSPGGSGGVKGAAAAGGSPAPAAQPAVVPAKGTVNLGGVKGGVSPAPKAAPVKSKVINLSGGAAAAGAAQPAAVSPTAGKKEGAAGDAGAVATPEASQPGTKGPIPSAPKDDNSTFLDLKRKLVLLQQQKAELSQPPASPLVKKPPAKSPVAPKLAAAKGVAQAGAGLTPPAARGRSVKMSPPARPASSPETAQISSGVGGAMAPPMTATSEDPFKKIPTSHPAASTPLSLGRGRGRGFTTLPPSGRGRGRGS